MSTLHQTLFIPETPRLNCFLRFFFWKYKTWNKFANFFAVAIFCCRGSAWTDESNGKDFSFLPKLIRRGKHSVSYHWHKPREVTTKQTNKKFSLGLRSPSLLPSNPVRQTKEAQLAMWLQGWAWFNFEILHGAKVTGHSIVESWHTEWSFL